MSVTAVQSKNPSPELPVLIIGIQRDGLGDVVGAEKIARIAASLRDPRIQDPDTLVNVEICFVRDPAFRVLSIDYKERALAENYPSNVTPVDFNEAINRTYALSLLVFAPPSINELGLFKQRLCKISENDFIGDIEDERPPMGPDVLLGLGTNSKGLLLSEECPCPYEPDRRRRLANLRTLPPYLTTIILGNEPCTEERLNELAATKRFYFAYCAQLHSLVKFADAILAITPENVEPVIIVPTKMIDPTEWECSFLEFNGVVRVIYENVDSNLKEIVIKNSNLPSTVTIVLVGVCTNSTIQTLMRNTEPPTLVTGDRSLEEALDNEKVVVYDARPYKTAFSKAMSDLAAHFDPTFRGVCIRKNTEPQLLGDSFLASAQRPASKWTTFIHHIRTERNATPVVRDFIKSKLSVKERQDPDLKTTVEEIQQQLLTAIIAIRTDEQRGLLLALVSGNFEVLLNWFVKAPDSPTELAVFNILKANRELLIRAQEARAS